MCGNTDSRCPTTATARGTRLKAGGVSPLSLLTFFAAAKKVSAAPHRGNANRPQTNQGKAKEPKKQPNPAKQAKKNQPQPSKKRLKNPPNRPTRAQRPNPI